MTRAEILDAARKCVCGERDRQYGGPEQSFRVIADLWSTYLSAVISLPVCIEGDDVAAMMALLKIARIATAAVPHPDSWIDLAGYAACGGELDEDEQE
ncbi:MAG: DUF6378 domain-containing protein [Bacteroidales bacterium]|nr:DUF6378 domain-containing protein [Bacteroidales bacterium]